MKLTEISEGSPGRRKDLARALRQIYGGVYGRGDRGLSGFERADIHDPAQDAGADPGSGALSGQGSADRTRDGGTPAKPKHRKFFRMSNDGAGGNIRY